MTSPQPPGTPDVFDQIVLVADAQMGTDPVDDILRASLLSGAACARSIVGRIPSFEDSSAENQIGAVLLTEFWSAVIASRMLGRVEDRGEVILGIAERFAGGIFGSSVSALTWSLETFETQLTLGMEGNAEAGATSIGPMTWFFLYWRSHDLLLGDLPLQGHYYPAVDLAAWLGDPRNAGIAPPKDVEGATMAREILLWGMDTAAQHYTALRDAAEEAAAESNGHGSPGD